MRARVCLCVCVCVVGGEGDVKLLYTDGPDMYCSC